MKNSDKINFLIFNAVFFFKMFFAMTLLTLIGGV
jgi:hypothetical protein